jgi:hypothetical protein
MSNEPKKVGLMQVKKFLGFESIREFKTEWMKLSAEERKEIQEMVAESVLLDENKSKHD